MTDLTPTEALALTLAGASLLDAWTVADLGEFGPQYLRNAKHKAAELDRLGFAVVPVVGYEYGIRNTRDQEMHRWGMTPETAQQFMDPAEWDGVDPTRLYEIVRRPVGDWEPVPDKES